MNVSFSTSVYVALELHGMLHVIHVSQKHTHAHTYLFVLVAGVLIHSLHCLNCIYMDISMRFFMQMYSCLSIWLCIWICGHACVTASSHFMYISVFVDVWASVSVCLCMSKYMCCFVRLCESTDGSVSGLEPGWVCLYESRQCACAGEWEGRSGSWGGWGAGGGSTRPRGPPLVDSLTDDMH